jgi:hypothetical protein
VARKCPIALQEAPKHEWKEIPIRCAIWASLSPLRWRGLAKAAVQVHLTAIAYNLKRTMNILAVAA